MKFTIEQLLDQQSLSQEEAHNVMLQIISGKYDDAWKVGGASAWMTGSVNHKS